MQNLVTPIQWPHNIFNRCKVWCWKLIICSLCSFLPFYLYILHLLNVLRGIVWVPREVQSSRNAILDLGVLAVAGFVFLLSHKLFSGGGEKWKNKFVRDSGLYKIVADTPLQCASVHTIAVPREGIWHLFVTYISMAWGILYPRWVRLNRTAPLSCSLD